MKIIKKTDKHAIHLFGFFMNKHIFKKNNRHLFHRLSVPSKLNVDYDSGSEICNFKQTNKIAELKQKIKIKLKIKIRAKNGGKNA